MDGPRQQSRGAFTLIELIVVVGIIGVLLAIAMPGWAKYRDLARVGTCVENLRQLHGAKVQWALEFHKGNDDIPSPEDLAPFLRAKALPECPGGGAYTLRRASKYPVCSLYPQGHTLNIPPGDDAEPD